MADLVCARCGATQRPFASLGELLFCAGEGDQLQCFTASMAGTPLPDGSTWSRSTGWAAATE